MKLLIKGGRVVDPANGRDGVFDVLVDGDRIARVARDLQVQSDVTVVDLPAGAVVCPGLIDMHVHLREPGHEYVEHAVPPVGRIDHAGPSEQPLHATNPLPARRRAGITRPSGPQRR